MPALLIFGPWKAWFLEPRATRNFALHLLPVSFFSGTAMVLKSAVEHTSWKKSWGPVVGDGQLPVEGKAKGN